MHGARLKKTSDCAHRAETPRPCNVIGQLARRSCVVCNIGSEEMAMNRKTWIVTVAALATAGVWLAPAGEALAQPRRDHDRDHDRVQVRARVSIGTQVRVLPGGHETIRLGRTYYHYHDGV